MRSLIRLALTTLLLSALLFLAAGDAGWREGWAFALLWLLCTLVNMVVTVRTHPDLLAERAKVRSGTKRWDLVLAPAVALVGPLAVLVVAGLERRYGGAVPGGPAWQWLGLAAVAAGLLLGTWAMAANNFFAATVRIQTDRGHAVASTGPYALVRHPGYLGGVLFNLGLPLALGSRWALLPAVLTVGALLLRTALEDRTLQAELPGYREYAAMVRSRLVPGVW